MNYLYIKYMVYNIELFDKETKDLQTKDNHLQCCTD